MCNSPCLVTTNKQKLSNLSKLVTIDKILFRKGFIEIFRVEEGVPTEGIHPLDTQTKNNAAAAGCSSICP